MKVEHITLLFIINLNICHFSKIHETNATGRIVMGQVADIEQFSYSALLKSQCEDYSVFSCGGSIVTNRLILTAAHCLRKCDYDMMAIVGSNNEYYGTRYRISDFKRHEQYSPDYSRNDIALLMTRDAIEFGPTVTRVALTTKVPYGVDGTIAGFGGTDESGGSHVHILHYTTGVRIWEAERCLTVFKLIPNGTFCAGYKKTKSYPFRGDSGSALIVRRYMQVGLVSYRSPSLSKSITIYSSIPYYYNWIAKSMVELMCKNRK